MSIPSSLKGFDVDAAVERMLGQTELWWAAVGLFVQHFADWEGLWLAARGDDAQECKKVHALRSAAANVGANKLACAAAVLEELIAMRLAGKNVVIPPSVRWYVQDCFREVWSSASEAGVRHSVLLDKAG
jgi:HPt (histidine-containing phosphotransfer) domain-containing protein